MGSEQVKTKFNVLDKANGRRLGICKNEIHQTIAYDWVCPNCDETNCMSGTAPVVGSVMECRYCQEDIEVIS